MKRITLATALLSFAFIGSAGSQTLQTSASTSGLVIPTGTIIDTGGTSTPMSPSAAW